MARYFAVCLKMDDFGERASKEVSENALGGFGIFFLWLIPPNQYSIFEPTFEIEREIFLKDGRDRK